MAAPRPAVGPGGAWSVVWAAASVCHRLPPGRARTVRRRASPRPRPRSRRRWRQMARVPSPRSDADHSSEQGAYRFTQRRESRCPRPRHLHVRDQTRVDTSRLGESRRRRAEYGDQATPPGPRFTPWRSPLSAYWRSRSSFCCSVCESIGFVVRIAEADDHVGDAEVLEAADAVEGVGVERDDVDLERRALAAVLAPQLGEPAGSSARGRRCRRASSRRRGARRGAAPARRGRRSGSGSAALGTGQSLMLGMS